MQVCILKEGYVGFPSPSETNMPIIVRFNDYHTDIYIEHYRIWHLKFFFPFPPFLNINKICLNDEVNILFYFLVLFTLFLFISTWFP